MFMSSASPSTRMVQQARNLLTDLGHRPHQARDLRPPDCDDITTAEMADLTTARTRRRRILGGLINEYERAA